ncbi:DUF6011 domain-containing protein [Nocardia takedensis]|uniref:DUF6011 domain-containing protein n=1 Tax=Nocardia takedensis TaxID=259390 RepID=UPI003F75EE7F
MADDATPDDLALADGTPARLAVQCRCCNGWLVAAPSVAARIGPVCARHERAAARAANQPVLFDLTADQN